MSKKLYKVVPMSEGFERESKLLDDLVNEALLKHTKTHLTVYGYPPEDYSRVFQEAISAGYYNGKTVTYVTPEGTITFHAKVGAPNE